MYRVMNFIKYAGFMVAFAAMGLVLAAEVTLDPSTWFVDQKSVLAAAALILSWVVKVFTALGKDWFHTDGKYTVWLSAALSVIIAGVGGYFGLGYLAGQAGIISALQAAGLVLFSFLTSNGMAKSERQVAASVAERLTSKLK